MSRLEPKFNVGDEVIINSKEDDRFNGSEGKIVRSEYWERSLIVNEHGGLGIQKATWVHWLDTDPGNIQRENFAWGDDELRPKPKRDDSAAFDRFMKKLDLDKPANVPIAPKQLEEA